MSVLRATRLARREPGRLYMSGFGDQSSFDGIVLEHGVGLAINCADWPAEPDDRRRHKVGAVRTRRLSTSASSVSDVSAVSPEPHECDHFWLRMNVKDGFGERVRRAVYLVSQALHEGKSVLIYCQWGIHRSFSFAVLCLTMEWFATQRQPITAESWAEKLGVFGGQVHEERAEDVRSLWRKANEQANAVVSFFGRTSMGDSLLEVWGVDPYSLRPVSPPRGTKRSGRRLQPQEKKRPRPASTPRASDEAEVVDVTDDEGAARVTLEPIASNVSNVSSGSQRVGRGDWICPECGNYNYWRRGRCHGKHGACGRLRPNDDTPLRDCDWFCACGNRNYGSREYCNRNTCQMPREEGEML